MQKCWLSNKKDQIDQIVTIIVTHYSNPRAAVSSSARAQMRCVLSRLRACAKRLGCCRATATAFA